MSPRGSDRQLSDAEFIARLRAGDTEALATLMRTHTEPLIAYAVTIVGSVDGAQDVVQDVFIRVWQRRDTLNEDVPIVPYVFRAVRNGALDARRQTRRASARDETAAELGVGVPSGEATPDVAVETDELSRVTAHVLATLPVGCRDIFLLIRRGGLTYQQAADVLGVSISTVKTQMGRAVAALGRVVIPGFMIAVVRTLLRGVA